MTFDPESSDFTANLIVENRQRTFRVHQPQSVAENRALIIAFHGTGINGQRMAEFCNLNSLADESDFIVLYPDGSGKNDTSLQWNTGHPASYATRHQVNDLEFVKKLIDWSIQHLQVNPGRVYLAGMSSGGILCYELAIQISSQIAAVASVAGTLCDFGRPPAAIPVIHFHGTNDSHVPYEGGRGDRNLTKIEFASAANTIDWWAKANQCTHRRMQRPRITINDGTWIIREAYLNSAEEERVILFTIKNGGHTWPGSTWSEAAAHSLGTTTLNLHANQEIWSFFQKHES